MPPKNKKDFSWGRFSKTLSFWILILLVPVALIQLSSARAEQAPPIDYTKYRDELERNNIREVVIQAGKTVRGKFRQRITPPNSNRDVGAFTTQLPMENSEEEVKELRARGVRIRAEDARPSIMAWIVNFLPWLLLIGFYLFLFKQMQAGGAK
ncbi:MAG: ATP-dependent metallopeptidase FtsH/Yme1/Tma family protein, partial [Gemmatimonadota bacterium]|nr:ATP-dependent metallopeptidase FtsH/Yme1/Tma family protein [Gemmatimonadota bacterium]